MSAEAGFVAHNLWFMGPSIMTEAPQSAKTPNTDEVEFVLAFIDVEWQWICILLGSDNRAVNLYMAHP